MEEAREKSKYSTYIEELDLSVDKLIEECRLPSADDFLIREMIITAIKMKLEENATLDLKIASMAQKELRYAFKVFKDYQRFKKVTVFGSARTEEGSPTYNLARDFARAMTDHGYMVITGAGGGIMQAANEGAGHDKSFGLNIRLPFEQRANRFILDDKKLIIFKYFFTRKLMFVKEADAFVLFPGGFGTLDESMEILTLTQTGKSTPLPVVMLDIPGGTFWKNFIDYVKTNLMDSGYISPHDLSYLFVTDNVESACAHILHFYRNFHSMRVVGRYMVIRLKTHPKEESLTRLNRDFADILKEGEFHIRGPFEDELNDIDIVELPRLAFIFDGKSFGRLRELIDAINDTKGEVVYPTEKRSFRFL
ncbi:MAG: TIGR00730 family Rossman fold protein [Vulcanimicrobiota bacterium]